MSKAKQSTTDLARRIPSLLWPETSLHLQPLLNDNVASLRAFGPMALLLHGSSRSVQELAADSGSRLSTAGFRYAILKWSASAQWDVGIQVLCEVALALRAAEPPIDYARRERLVGTELLMDSEEWREVSDQTSVYPGGAKRLLLANAYLYELLTAGDPGKWQPAIGLRHSSLWTDYRSFCVGINEETVQLMRAWAQRWLRRKRVNEPLTWAPPMARAEPSPDFLEVAWTGVRSRRSCGEIADQLGVDLEHLRAVLLMRPGPRPAPGPSKERARVPRIGPLGREAIKAQLDAGLGVKEIARRIGRDRKTVAAAIREHGLSIPSVGRTAARLDPEWLTEQYWTKRRTLPEIAADLGMTPTNLGRRFRDLGIPLRSRGGASHAVPLEGREPADIPRPLRDALKGQGAVQRLERFAEMAVDGNLAKTGRRLQVASGTLSTQLGKLESDTGLQLMLRGRRGPGVSHRLSASGQLLISQFDEWRRLGVEQGERPSGMP